MNGRIRGELRLAGLPKGREREERVDHWLAGMGW